ncbi:recombinase family protein [Agrobacterium tumefaciens]|nr:recombinase family protein [Agrobacterium tumefaciens]
MPNVALYARYSTDLQNSKSIDHQFNLCRQFAERQGWKVVGYYRDEAISGANIRGRNGKVGRDRLRLCGALPAKDLW